VPGAGVRKCQKSWRPVVQAVHRPACRRSAL